MNVRYPLHRPGTLLVLLLFFAARLLAQNPCSQPIALSSVLVSNSTCGNSTGTIIVTPEGGTGGFLYIWSPLVSTSNIATNLPAATYQLRLVRILEPECQLDTTIVVNNSNGPQVDVTIDPSDCLEPNGKVTLAPANLMYQWSNGASGHMANGLASGCYYVTATVPSTSCYSVLKAFVPTENPLNITVNVTQQAKCGRKIGKAEIMVTGGSGNYSYSPGPLPQLNNLAPGNYFAKVLDNVTGCQDSVPFTILDLQVSGSVSVTPHNARCPGGANGFVEFQVTPGQNFTTPHFFWLRDSNGQLHTPGNLGAGQYLLTIYDADSCALPVAAFSIAEPPALDVQAQVIPETCTQGGSITLNFSGGNGGPYATNWADLPGADDPKNRSNLPAGLYSVTVYDSLFCNYMLDTFFVPPQCNRADTTYLVVQVNTTDFHCENSPPGLGTGTIAFNLVGGGFSGSSNFGTWLLNTDGCLAYSAGATPGFAVDTVCIERTASQLGLKDTTCVLIIITKKQPTKQTVFFTVQAGNAGTACGSIPPLFDDPLVVQIGRPGLNGSSDVYGVYSIHDTSACLTFQAANVAGFNVDEINVAVCDTAKDECHIISYLPTVLPTSDCTDAAELPPHLELEAPDCDAHALTCVPIPYDDIVNYTILDNDAVYNAGYLGCDDDTTLSYNINVLPPGGGPYELIEWEVNGQIFTGNFLSMTGLAALMSQLDPLPGWTAQGVSLIRGGNTASNYGALKVKSAQGNISTYDPIVELVSLGSELRFTPGFHQVIFRNVQNACTDTMTLNVTCDDCPPIHGYPLDVFGNVNWEIPDCDADTVFCTSILNSDLGDYTVTDNNQAFLNFSACGDYAGLRLDTGFHLLHFQNNALACTYTFGFRLACRETVASDTLLVAVPLDGQITLCLDTSLLASPILSISNLCEDDGGSTIVGYAYDAEHWCLDLSGLSLGADTLCIQLCNANSQCAIYYVFAEVLTPTDSLIAVPDAVFTLKNEAVEIEILANDIVNGIPGNSAALAEVELLTIPLLGSISINPSNGFVLYTPDADRCGVDSFAYRITDTLGQQSSTIVTVTIICDKVLVFTGISPNDDGRNDSWQILGIEQFPGNEVWIFNRWGSLVFHQKGYSNLQAWDGRWNGKDLPEGTYFYLLDLGSEGGRLEGYLEIMR